MSGDSSVSKVYADEVSFEVAQNFWRLNSLASPFCSPLLLKKLCHEPRFFAAWKGSEVLSMWPVPCDEEGRAISVPFSVYLGPYWKDGWESRAEYRKFSTGVVAQQALINLVGPEFSNLEFELSPDYADIRGFLWWNHGMSEREKVCCKVKYTATINGLSNKSDFQLLSSFRSDDKRKKLRKLLDSALPIELAEVSREEDVLAIYRETMARSGELVSEEIEVALRSLIEFARDGGGAVLGAFDSSGSCIGYQLLLVEGGRPTGHAISAGVTQAWRKADIGPLLTFESIKYCRETGAQAFDFNGANSPQRGDDKHAFGAAPVVYFNLALPSEIPGT